MRSFFCPDIPAPGREARLDGEEARHALRVLRLQEGEWLRLIDGKGNRASAQILGAAGRNRHSTLTCRILDRQSWLPPQRPLHLLIAPPRAKFMAQIIQIAVELGAGRLTPILCEHSVARPEADAGSAHWQAEAVAASKQSGNPILPIFDPPRPFALALTAVATPGFYGALPDPAQAAATATPALPAGQGIIPVWIGPEGGFSPAEQAALAAAGHRPLALGSWTLRVETAAAAIIGYLVGMGGDDLCCHQHA